MALGHSAAVRWLLVLLAAVSLLYFYRIGDVPLTDGDSALYGYIAKDLVRSGDWQTMRWRGGPFLDKPPLTMWGMALGYLVFGFNEAGARAWQSVLAVLTVLVTFAIGRLYYRPRAALLGAAMLATSLQFLYQQFVPQQDVPLTLAVALGFYLVGLSLQRGWWGYDYLAGAAFGVAVMAKGLVGVLLPGIVLVARVLLEWGLGGRPVGELVRTWAGRTARGFVALLAVAAPWFVAEGLRHGFPFLDLFFFGGNERFMTRLQDIPKGPIYLAYLAVGLLPWTGLFWPALRQSWRAAVRGQEGDRLLVAWFFGVLFLFGVLVGWKVMRYILPLYPAAALMLGKYGDELWDVLERRNDRGREALAALRQASAVTAVLVVPLLGLGLWSLSRQFPQEARAYWQLLWPYLAALGVNLAVVASCWWLGRLQTGLAAGLVLSAASYVLLINQVAAGWDSVSPWRAMAREVARHQGEGVPVLFEPGIPPHGDPFADFYVEPRPELAADDEALLSRHPELPARQLLHAGGGWVVALGQRGDTPAEDPGSRSATKEESL